MLKQTCFNKVCHLIMSMDPGISWKFGNLAMNSNLAIDACSAWKIWQFGHWLDAILASMVVVKFFMTFYYQVLEKLENKNTLRIIVLFLFAVKPFGVNCPHLSNCSKTEFYFYSSMSHFLNLPSGDDFLQPCNSIGRIVTVLVNHILL